MSKEKETDLPEEKKQDDRCHVTGNYILNLNPTIGPPPKPNAQHYEVMIGDKLAFRQEGEWTINYPEKALEMLIESVRYLESQKQEWISVKERFPDNDDIGQQHIVALYFKTSGPESICAIYLGEMTWYNLEDKKHQFHNVTHWQPLPSPPKL